MYTFRRVFSVTIRVFAGVVLGTIGRAHSYALPVFRAGRRAGKGASGIRVSPRSVADGGSRRAGTNRKAPLDRRGRYGYGQDAGVPAAGDSLGQAGDHLDRHQDAAGTTVSQRPALPAGASGRAAGV